MQQYMKDCECFITRDTIANTVSITFVPIITTRVS